MTFNQGLLLERLSGISKAIASYSAGSTTGWSAWRRVNEHGTEPRALSRTSMVSSSGTASRSSTRCTATVRPTVLLLPTWSIIHSRCWKMQIPYLARYHRVITFDPRGNGRSDRPAGANAYGEREFAADARGRPGRHRYRSRHIVGFSMGAQRSLLLAAEYPARVAGVVLSARRSHCRPLCRATCSRRVQPAARAYQGWGKYNRHYWLSDYEDFLEFFFSQVYTEPHSTKHTRRLGGLGD